MPSNIIMKQINVYQWQIVSEKGTVLQDNLSFSHTWRAEEYVKNYITSFIDWSYTVITLEEGQKDEKNNNRPDKL